jgi:hypothetical protein
MKKLKILFIILIFISCSNKVEIIKAELHFKLAQLIPSDGFNYIQIKEIEKVLLNNKSDNLDYLRTLKSNNLLDLPHIHIKVDDDVLQVFLKKHEFEKVKKYSLERLNKIGKKVILKISIKKIDTAIFYSDKIIEVKEIDGNTSFSK